MTCVNLFLVEELIQVVCLGDPALFRACDSPHSVLDFAGELAQLLHTGLLTDFPGPVVFEPSSHGPEIETMQVEAATAASERARACCR